MGRVDNLAMKTDPVGEDLISSDVNELKAAAKKLIKDATKLGGLGFGTSFLKWVASFAAIYLLILDRTNWRTNMLTSLLVPYIFFSLPSVLFNFLRGEVGKWIAFIAVVLRLFFPRHFPDWLEMPGSLILLLVVAPNFFAETLRDSWVGVLICLFIGCYLLQEHISSLRWIQELIHTKPWNIQHYWHHPTTSLSCLGFRTSLPLSSICFHLQCKISTSVVNVIPDSILTFIFF